MIKKILHHNNPAKDFFLYLLLFFSLAFIVFGEGAILFQFINKFINDPIERAASPFYQGAVKFGIASLIIAGPIFFVVSRNIFRRILAKKTPLDSSVRKWLTYIVIFLSSAAIIIDLIALITRFLGGDAPWGFLSKMLVILLIAGSILSYYFWNMLRAKNNSSKIRKKKIIAYSYVGILAATLISAFFVIDSPAVSKQKHIDRQVVSNLQNIDMSVREYYSQSSKLPSSMNELRKTELSPEIQKGVGNIAYGVKANNAYMLCADFLLSDKGANSAGVASSGWEHDAGKVCFDRIALPNSK